MAEGPPGQCSQQEPRPCNQSECLPHQGADAGRMILDTRE
jgi:hypothetical protein